MSFFNFKNLAMTSSMTSSFPKSGGFVYSLLPMYIVSFKFVQALLLFKIAGEGSQGKKNARKKKKKNRTITIVVRLFRPWAEPQKELYFFNSVVHPWNLPDFLHRVTSDGPK